MTSTTEHVADGAIERMTAAQARYHLRRARERIASLVTMLDIVREDAGAWRARARKAEAALARVRHMVSATDEQPD